MTAPAPLNRRFCVAPMMDYTDRHARYLLRLLSRHAVLYTEMVTTGALIHGDRDRHLAFDPFEQPVAVQLGGSDPDELATSARIAEDYGYAEINLNCGCPSDRVQRGTFGACLMAEPERVAAGVAAMIDAVAVPVTVKCRIGIDDQEDYPALRHFVDTVASGGCRSFIVHARKAWLQGLSPKENRDIPPLRYELVHQLKAERPDLEIIINGGLTDLDQVADQLQHVDGVMLGREAYHNPYLLSDVDARFYHDPHPVPERAEVVADYLHYLERQLAAGVKLGHMARHLLGLYQGQPGARRYRRALSEHMHAPGADATVVRNALATLPG